MGALILHINIMVGAGSYLELRCTVVPKRVESEESNDVFLSLWVYCVEWSGS